MKTGISASGSKQSHSPIGEAREKAKIPKIKIEILSIAGQDMNPTECQGSKERHSGLLLGGKHFLEETGSDRPLAIVQP